MFDIKLLDCTLRDGGFINDWQFGHENIAGIAQGLAKAGVDIIEVGFLDGRRTFDKDRSIMPDTDSAAKIYGKLKKSGAMLVGMIDYGTCPLQNISPCEKSPLDGIRVIFKKHLRTPALAFCAALKRLGYLVFVQPVSITDYSDAEIKELALLANEVQPFSVSLVDTYGLLHGKELLRYFELLHRTLSKTIRLGFHGHNNFQMAYANCVSMIDAATAVGRPLLLDGSLCGMGKSAGNAPLELLAHHLSHYTGASYRMEVLLAVIEKHICPLLGAPPWGYSIRYFLCAACACHPSYVMFLENLGLSLSAIYTLLCNIDPPKRLNFDKAHIEALYEKYQKEADYAALPL